jgi:glycosyltransferase involved in cell wall biosynthesis
VAYNRTAVPDTLGDSGVLVNNIKCDEIAEMINQIAEDDSFRNKIIQKQSERLKYFERQNVEDLLRGYIQQVVD